MRVEKPRCLLGHGMGQQLTVLEGEIRSQVNDGPVTTYKSGQSFCELPGDRHGVSANASKSKPAKLLAVFVVDTNETELTIPFGN